MTEETAAPAGMEEAEVDERTLASARRMTRADMKRYEIYQERRKRLLNRGVSEEDVDKAMAEEDYRNSPLLARFERFEKAVIGAIRGFQNDVSALHHNDRVVADALDINLRAMSRCLEKAGVSKEVQDQIVKEVDRELQEEAKKQQAAQEKKTIETQADAAPATDEPVPTPDGATVFGG